MAASPAGNVRILLGRAVPLAPGWDARGRLVVFGKPPSAPDSADAPLAESSGTDIGDDAAPLTDPTGRRLLRAGDPRHRTWRDPGKGSAAER